MEERFYLETLRALVSEGWLDPEADVLAVAATEVDRDVMSAVGLRSVTISNLDERLRGDEFAPYRWSFEDASDLSFDDGSFSYCICHQGLHHCRSPHRALLEMYRVARRGVVVFEPHDTLLTRLGVRVGIGQRYETALDMHGAPSGGVHNSEIPNFVYRWSFREASKTLASFDPIAPPRVRCYYDLRLPTARIARLRNPVSRRIAQAAVPIARLVLRLVPSQANAVALVVDRLDPRRDLHPWLVANGEQPALDLDWIRARYETDPRRTSTIAPASIVLT